MKPFYPFIFFALSLIFLLAARPANAQAMPEVLDEGTLEQQFEHLHERTGIYNNFRAIREDMFQKIRRNSLDSLKRAYAEISLQKQLQAQALASKDSMQQMLAEVSTERDIAVRDRDSLFLLGIPMSKTVYNLVLWSIIIALAVLFIIALILFKRSNTITRQKTRELNTLEKEYEEYRKTSRERYEQQSIDHFNEIKRMKGI